MLFFRARRCFQSGFFCEPLPSRRLLGCPLGSPRVALSDARSAPQHSAFCALRFILLGFGASHQAGCEPTPDPTRLSTVSINNSRSSPVQHVIYGARQNSSNFELWGFLQRGLQQIAWMLSKQLFDSSFPKSSPASKGARANPLHARGRRRTLLWVVQRCCNLSFCPALLLSALISLSPPTFRGRLSR